MNIKYKLLLFDLDNTLLDVNKCVSENTLKALLLCKKQGIMIGIATSRSEKNSLNYISKIQPDVLICSGGAVVKCGNRYILISDFTIEETQTMIKTAKEICGFDCEITIDTIENHYWNYKAKPTIYGSDWGVSTFSDFKHFSERALKMCVEIFDSSLANKLADSLPNCNCVKFSGEYWYKFAKHQATKEYAMLAVCQEFNISLNQVVTFGDDWSDINMLKLSGKGVAVENAIPEVKAVADQITKSNNEDGVATFIFDEIL